MATQPAPLQIQPGVKRDGTIFEGNQYVDGQWCRFQRGLPRKIGGYKDLTEYITEASRGLSVFSDQSTIYVHTGGVDYLQRFTIDSDGISSVSTDRTPATVFAANDDNMWMFDVMYDSSTTDNTLIAHVAPNASDTGSVFVGNVLATAALTPITLLSGTNATGGIVVLHPYLFYYGTAGVIAWSVAGAPQDTTGTGSGAARVTGTKIIKGLPLRAGGAASPAGIFWAEDAVIRASFTGGATIFQFDTLATGTSILSSNCVIDYDGVFYWPGVDRFLMFNGVVREIPNNFNTNWFYDNLNQNQRHKVFAVKVPKYGEIWWCYPRGTATECTHAVIFNAREGYWYDTELPADMRTSAAYSNTYAAPIMIGATPGDNGYKAWRHEFGVNALSGTVIAPIKSYFETSDISVVAGGMNNKTRITCIEPDFVQTGELSVTITGRANARAKDFTGDPITFPDYDNTTIADEVISLKEQRRELRLRFESNIVDGDYQMGQILVHIGTGDGGRLG